MRKDIVFVFDWDGVVFDVAKFKRATIAHLLRHGLPRRAYKETYPEGVDSGGQYDAFRHIKALSKRTGILEKAIITLVFSAADDTSGFVFADASRMLYAMKKARMVADVLTSGAAEYQEYKIARSKLRALFRDVHVARTGRKTARSKTEALRKIARRHEKVYFFDDRLATIKEVHRSKALRGRVVPVLIDRKRAYRGTEGFLVVSRLSFTAIKKLAAA